MATTNSTNGLRRKSGAFRVFARYMSRYRGIKFKENSLGLLLLAILLAWSALAHSAELSIEQRIACRETIEDIQWSHRVWPESNKDPKPARSQMVSNDFIRREVLDALRMESALRDLYQIKLDADALQTELNRMASDTRAPERLRELFAAFGNDPNKIAECLVRPDLSERRLREQYEFDVRWHGAVRARAEAALAEGAGLDAIVASGGSEQLVSLVRRAQSSASGKAGPAEIELSAMDFGREQARLSSTKLPSERVPTEIGEARLRETAAAFIEESVVAATDERIDVHTRIWKKQDFQSWWSLRRAAYAPSPAPELSAKLVLPSISQGASRSSKAAADVWLSDTLPAARFNHTAIWTGSEMIIWGGFDGSYLGTGARYNPTSDSWRSVTNIGAPAARYLHAAVWTGREMIIWGGQGAAAFDSGARYDPVTDHWSGVSSTGAPSARYRHTAVWDGASMIVWGGENGPSFGNGGRYHPLSDTWTSISNVGAPAARHSHSASWTGSLMIVWGGNNGAFLTDGARYDPISDAWSPVANSGSPGARVEHSVVWTGVELIVWGGYDGAAYLGTGARYSPANDIWTAITSVGAPAARYLHTAVWSGSEMIVWGGFNGAPLNSGARYDPSSDSWLAMPAGGSPSSRYEHKAIWTGSEMLVWGGFGGGYVNTGSRYNPVNNAWTAMGSGFRPEARFVHTAEWTGNEMIIWGGESSPGVVVGNGAKFNPATAVWSPVSALGAPPGSSSRKPFSVWTGTEMLVWGGATSSGIGFSNLGARYNPSLNSWSAINSEGGPSARVNHATVWTGSEMIVWGGNGPSGAISDGARYSPASDTWLSLPPGPSARLQPEAQWTGSQMVIWAGYSGSSYLQTGSRYSPGTDSWSALTLTGAPSARFAGASVWSGAELIAWGGESSSGYPVAGGRYNPALDAWSSTSLAEVPPGGYGMRAVWTGEDMVVWGGLESGIYRNTGGLYNPVSDSWQPTTLNGAPMARHYHSAVWTGSSMLVFGGRNVAALGDLAIYFPRGVPQPTTTSINATSPDPSVVGEPVVVGVVVVGANTQPTSGQVEIMASTGETCTDTSIVVGSGNGALFACSLSFNSVGTRNLTAVYSGSSTHATSSSALESHNVVALPTLSVSDVSALEGPSGSKAFEFTVSRSHALNHVSVQVDTANGTATSGTDYTPISAQLINLPAGGALTSTVTVSVIGDAVLEPDENFFVNLTGVTGAALTDGQGEGTIRNDDAASIAINSLSLAETNSGATNAVFTATLAGAVQGGFTVPISSLDGSANAPSDYAAIPPGTMLTFAGTAGETRTVTVAVNGDTILEPDETFTVSLGAPSNAAVTVSTATGTGTITNDDAASIAINSLSLAETNSGATNAVFTATLAGAVQGGFTVPISSLDGSANAPSDYAAIPPGTMLTFAGTAGETRTVTVAVNGDVLFESDETFTVTLGTPSNGNVTISASTGIGTIANDDVAPTISVDSPSQNEGNSGSAPMNFVVSLSAPAGRDIHFDRATADGTATAANNDYVALPTGTATIIAGQTSVTIPVTINGDGFYEGNETFSLNLTAVDGATPTILSATGTLVEDDPQPTTTTILSQSPSLTVVGQAYSVTVQVAAQTSSPLGSVTISDGSASCGPTTLTAGIAPSSTASCSLTSTTAGTKTLTVSYTPASSAHAGSSGSAPHLVNPAGTTISVSGPARTRINQATTFSFALMVLAPGAGAPTGTVTLSSGPSTCTAILPATSCNLSFSGLGNRTVSASYAGDGNYSPSASSAAGNTQTLVFAQADVAVSKTDGISVYRPGDLIVYTVQLRNLGPDGAENLRLRDTLPVGLASAQWSCDASGGASCPQASGSGGIDANIAMFPTGAFLTYTLHGNAQGSAPELINTALVDLPADTTIDDPAMANNSATDTDLLDALFLHGFENPAVRAASGSYRMPSGALRTVLDNVARAAYALDDSQGEALRVYARVWQGEVQYAVARRAAGSALRLGEWRSYSGEPLLSWTARPTDNGWVLDSVDLR